MENINEMLQLNKMLEAKTFRFQGQYKYKGVAKNFPRNIKKYFSDGQIKKYEHATDDKIPTGMGVAPCYSLVFFGIH